MEVGTSQKNILVLHIYFVSDTSMSISTDCSTNPQEEATIRNDNDKRDMLNT